MDLLLVVLCISLFCVLCVVVWQCNHMNYTAKVVLIVCSLIVFVIFLKNMHLCICEGAELTPGLWICQTRTKILLDMRG